MALSNGLSVASSHACSRNSVLSLPKDCHFPSGLSVVIIVILLLLIIIIIITIIILMIIIIIIMIIILIMMIIVIMHAPVYEGESSVAFSNGFSPLGLPVCNLLPRVTLLWH